MQESGADARIYKAGDDVMNDSSLTQAEPKMIGEFLKRPMLSKSKIGAFRQCPRKYYYMAVENREVDTIEFKIGREVHKAAEKFFKMVKIINGQLVVPPYVPLDDEAYDIPIQNMYKFERRRWAMCRQTDDPQKYFFPVMREVKIVNKEFGMSGIVDRVDRLLPSEGEGYYIVDYKTSKYRDWTLDEYRPELAIYKFLLDGSGLLDLPVTHGVIVFLKEFKQHTVKLEEEDIQKAFRPIESINEAHRTGEYPMKVGEHCKWCPYYFKPCPAGASPL